jgi:hypothetical protein
MVAETGHAAWRVIFLETPIRPRRPEPLAHDIEHRSSGHRRHPAAHLGEYDDPDDADDHGPDQLKAELGPGLRIENQVADIDEAADRGQDPERD